MKYYTILGTAICLALLASARASLPSPIVQSLDLPSKNAAALTEPGLARVPSWHSLRAWVDSTKRAWVDSTRAEGTDLSENALFHRKSLKEAAGLKVGAAIHRAVNSGKREVGLGPTTSRSLRRSMVSL